VPIHFESGTPNINCFHCKIYNSFLYFSFMINPYDYTFYKIYNLGTKRLNWPNPKTNSLILFVIPFLLHITTILRILLLKNININFLINIDVKLLSCFFLLILLVPNYLIFFRKNRIQLILAKYQNEPKVNKIIGSALVIIYFLCSFILFIVVSTIPLP
jgi:hypothetical protein